MKVFLTFCCFCCSWILKGQDYRIFGYITDLETGEVLEGVNVYRKGVQEGVSSNVYGFYSWSLCKGKNVIIWSIVGYESKTDTLLVESDMKMNVRLKRSNVLLEDVDIIAQRRKYSGHKRLLPEQLSWVPAVGGEVDLLKSIQFLPGIVGGNDGGNNISVRGGNQWQNLYLLDDAVVYNPNHSLSFFSAFNSTALREVNLYKSYIPSRYGGRLSSVLDMRMKDGNNKKIHFKGGVGLLSTKALLEGPIVKDKVSFLVSGRYGYPGSIAKVVSLLPWGNLASLKNTDIHFYDVNAKINAIVKEKSRLLFSFYTSSDHFMSSLLINDYVMDWRNMTSTVRWNYILNERMNLNTFFSFSDYRYNYKQIVDGQNYRWKSDIQSYSWQNKLDWFISDHIKMNVGFSAEYLKTIPGEIEKLSKMSAIISYRLDQRNNIQLAAFTELEWQLGYKWSLNGGVRFSANKASAPLAIPIHWMWNPEPRFELRYMPNRQSSIFLSSFYLTQQMHLLSTSSMGMPSDIWIPANNVLKPSSAIQLALGYERLSGDNKYTFSVEGYYKRMYRLPDYKDNVDFFMENEPEKIVDTGEGYSMGLELSLRKNKGKLQGEVNYTLSTTRIKMKQINDGDPYAPVYDRPHNLKMLLNYKFNEKWNISSTFALRSGMNVTIPVRRYIYQGSVFYEYTKRNAYRGPIFHQLDIQVNYKPFMTKRWQGEWGFGLMNVYNRKNVFTLFAGREKIDMTKQGIYKMYLYGILPSITYNIEF